MTNTDATLVPALRPAHRAALLEEAAYQGKVHAFAIKGGTDVSAEECKPHLRSLRQVIQARIVAKEERWGTPLAGEDVAALYRVAEAAFVGRMTGQD